MTKNPISEARRHYLGGSDIAAVHGISPYTTPVELYLRKRGEADEQADAPQLRRGRRLEPYVVDMYKDDTGRKVYAPAFVVGPEDWIAANLDGTSGSSASGGADRVLEVKTANQWTRRDWGEPGTDQVPVFYVAQCQWMLAITRFTRCDVAALIGVDDFRIFTIEADVPLQQRLIVLAREFWQRVQDGRPPEPTSTEDMALLFPQHAEGSIVEASDVDLSRISELRNVRRMIAEAEAREEELKLALQRRMGTAEILAIDETPLATWRSQSRTTVDTKAMRASVPDVVEQFERVASHRVFRIK